MKKVLLLFMIGLSVNALASERIGTQFLRSSDELMTDVIVQPPGSKKKGQLLVTGAVGVGQRETFILKKCRMESDQVPMKWGCYPVGNSYSHALNQEISVEEGVYEIKNNLDNHMDTGLPTYVKVKANRKTHCFIG